MTVLWLVTSGSWVLRSLGDLARSHAPRADANAFDAAVNHRSHGLQIRFEPPRAHVVRVTDLTADDGSLSAHCATFGHATPENCSGKTGSITGRLRQDQARRIRLLRRRSRDVVFLTHDAS